MVAPNRVGARLVNDGTFLTAGNNPAIFDDGLDEVTQSTHSVTATQIFADEFDEVTLSSGQPSGGSIVLNGTSQYLTVPGSGDFQFGNNPFTIEGWFYTTATTYQRLWCFPNGDNIEMLGSALYYWNGISQPIGSGSNVVPKNQWFHVALVKTSSTSAKVYVNGASVITDSTPFNSVSSRALVIGGEGSSDVTGQGSSSGADGFFAGNITNFRVVKGVAVYTDNFSTPYSPFSATQSSSVNISAITGSATVLLLKMTNSGALTTDDSGTNKAVTNVGGASYSALTPLSSTYNGKMKQRKSGSLLVANEFDEYTGI
jgi:hypothetical protein